MTITDWLTASSSLTLRVCAYVFLRWIPGHVFPPLIFTVFALYLISAIPALFQTAPYTVVSDEIDIVTKETVGRHDVEPAVDPELVDGELSEPLEELDVEETLVLEENDSRVLRTLLTGIPSPGSLLWSFVTVLLNLVLVLMVVDLTYTGKWFHNAHDLSMARVGYVSDSTAKILIREPHAVQYPVFLSYRHAGAPLDGQTLHDTSWKSAGSLSWLDDTTDYTGVFELKDLRSDTRYQYAATNNHSGYFTTAPRPGHVSARRGGSFTFLHSSCIKPHFPYNPFDNTLAIPGFAHLARILPSLRAQFMIFLGDFIYIDVPHRHGTDKESYRREYRQVYASPDWPSVSTQLGSELPWIHVLDDHEIANDWDRNTTGVYEAAADPWHHYHTSANPPAVQPGETYFSFVQGPAAFFMLDTRRYRQPFDGTNGTWTDECTANPKTDMGCKSMLGAQQRSDLLAFLSRRETSGVRWKIVISSIPMTKNWRFGSEDTWAGYLGERQVLLEAMWDVGLTDSGTGVVVLSGDRHEFAATAFPPPAEGRNLGPDPFYGGFKIKKWPISATVMEFSVSPLSMFYLPVRTYRQDDEEDVCVKYIPDGNSKFGAITLSTPPASDQSLLTYRLFVDGEEVWRHLLTTPPAVSGGGRGKDAIWG